MRMHVRCLWTAFFDDEIIDSYAIDVIIADAENEVDCEENAHGEM